MAPETCNYAVMIRVAGERRERFEESRNLATLIALYEANYVHLARLAPELERIDETVVSCVGGALDLYLNVVECHTYTTTLDLTYLFDTPSGPALEPNARIRVYHDVRAVELLSHCRRRRVQQHLPRQRGRMPEIDRKWEMNRFLLKWLKFCTHQGHLFLECTARSPSDAYLAALDSRRSVREA